MKKFKKFLYPTYILKFVFIDICAYLEKKELVLRIDKSNIKNFNSSIIQESTSTKQKR